MTPAQQLELGASLHTCLYAAHAGDYGSLRMLAASELLENLADAVHPGPELERRQLAAIARTPSFQWNAWARNRNDAARLVLTAVRTATAITPNERNTP